MDVQLIDRWRLPGGCPGWLRRDWNLVDHTGLDLKLIGGPEQVDVPAHPFVQRSAALADGIER